MTRKPDPLRYIAVAILGIVVGAIPFFIVAMVIGIFNGTHGMELPVRTDISENIWSLILFIVFIVLGVAGFCRKIRTTPTMPEEPAVL